MHYYIVENDHPMGPFDLIALVKKIKAGKVLENTLITLNGRNEMQPAAEISALQQFFAHSEAAEDIACSSHDYSFKELMASAVYYLKTNTMALPYSGLFLLTAILSIMMLGGISVIGYMLAFLAVYLLYVLYLEVQLKATRGQAFVFSGLVHILTQHLPSLTLAGAAVFVLAGAASLLLVAPGLLVLTLYSFTPFLIIERDMGFWEAMESSRRAVMSIGGNNTGVLLALHVINLIAIMLFVFPLLIVLPLTSHALCEIYDDVYN